MAETMIPEGRGKAEAMAAFLAQGGELVSKGGTRRPGMRYTSGPMRGKTIEQAQQMFEQKWAMASPAIKNKYAGRASSAGVLAPTEQPKMAANIAATPASAGTGAQWREVQKVKRAGLLQNARANGDTAAVDSLEQQGRLHDNFDKFKATGLDDAAAMREAKAISFPLKKAPDPTPESPRPTPTGAATPEENARAQAMLGDALGSDKYATASYGNGVDMAAAAAMGNDWMKQSEQRDLLKQRPDQAPQLTPEEIDANTKANQPIARSSPAAMRQADEQRMQASIAPTPPAAAAPPVAAAPTPAQAPPSPAPAETQPGGMSSLARGEVRKRLAANIQAPTGVPVLDRETTAYAGPNSSTKINRLTGLPFGYQPGDVITDPTMKARADQSVTRSQITDSKAAMALVSPVAANIAKPAFQPETRYTPGMGNVPVAKPVTDGTEQVSYDAYAAAGDRMKTPGGNSKQDSQDSALRSQFDKQAFQRQADEMRRKRLGTGRTGYTGPGMARL